MGVRPDAEIARILIGVTAKSTPGLLRDGPPAMVLLRVAEEEGVDLIVVGSRGVGGFAELQLGSTSTQVVQHAQVPVTVLPRSATAGPGPS